MNSYDSSHSYQQLYTQDIGSTCLAEYYFL